MESVCKEVAMASLWYYPSICLELLRNSKKTSVRIVALCAQFWTWDLQNLKQNHDMGVCSGISSISDVVIIPPWLCLLVWGSQYCNCKIYLVWIHSVCKSGCHELCCRQHKVQWDWRVMWSLQMDLSSVVSLEGQTQFHWMMVLQFAVVVVDATQIQPNRSGTGTQCVALLERSHTYFRYSL
jgi:hypothetical protein